VTGASRDPGDRSPDHDAIETAEEEFVDDVDQAALSIKVEAELVDF